MRETAASITEPAPAMALRPQRRRSHVEQFRTDDEEHAELERRSREAGLSLNAYHRLMTLGSPGPRARRRSPVDHEALNGALIAFNRENNNLNQLARNGNRLLLIAEQRGDRELLDAVRELARGIELLRQQFAAPLAAILAALTHDREG